MPVHHVVHHLALNLFFSPRPCLFCGSFAGLFPFVYIILEERDTTETVITEPRRVHLSSEQMLFFFPIYRIFSPLYLAFNSWNELTIVP